MNQPYMIYSDISADIPAQFAQENGIHFIPMHYTIGEEDRVCTQIEPEDVLKRFYDGQRAGDLTHTSQISPQLYMDTFRPLVAAGTPVLYLALSSGLSGTYQSSCIAAEDLAEKYPDTPVICVDSLAATAGMGHLLMAAVRNRANGMSIQENAKWLEQNRLRVCHWFMVEDLMYLKRGGRVSAATAVVGTALNIKPILKIENDGTLKNFAKVRGVKGALNQLVHYYAQASDGGDDEYVIVLHADSPQNADYLEQEIKKIHPKCHVTKMMLSPIIGAHTGPGMCAISHWGKR